MAHPWLLKVGCLLVVLLSLTHCSVRRVHYNDTVLTEQLAFIQPGKTTLAEVVQQLGAPDDLLESEFGMASVYLWSDTKSSNVDFGAVGRIFLPYSPSMTLGRTGIRFQEFHIYYTPQWIVQNYGFSQAEAEGPMLWFWPF